MDGVPAARRGRHLQHRGGHRQPAQHDRSVLTLLLSTDTRTLTFIAFVNMYALV